MDEKYMKQELALEMDRLIEAEDYTGFKRLLVERFSEFDKDEQEEIFMMVFMEAVEEQAADITLKPMQEEALAIADNLKILRDKLISDAKLQLEAEEDKKEE